MTPYHHSLVCPNGCSLHLIVGISLPRRQLLLYRCHGCQGIWIGSVNGLVQFTNDEVVGLDSLRGRFLADDLTS